ncbi:hypothetical protein KU406_23395, partial [Salmonella enterica subsp. enterica serovar Montevideo]|nr:hypothetical protein [Salmonella enterica subsp. enterica serovar Montevideo]
ANAVNPYVNALVFHKRVRNVKNGRLLSTSRFFILSSSATEADTVGRGPPEKLQSGTLPKNFKFTAISIIQWPALGRQLLMKGR